MKSIIETDKELRSYLNYVLMTLEQIDDGYYECNDENNFIPSKGISKELENEFNQIISIINKMFNLIEERAIKENIMLKEMLTKEQAMGELGRLTSRIAHDFNNILLGINMATNLFKMDIESGNLTIENTKMIVDDLIAGFEIGKTYVKNLLMFNIKQKYTNVKFPADLKNIINLPLNILNKELQSKNITVIKNFDDEKVEIKCVEGEITQLMLNLIVNARDAMEENGEGTLKINIWKEDKFAYLSISDTGIGMTEQMKTKIFEPLFTTKPEGKGTGLGMSIIQQIVESHNAVLTIDSKLGNGSTFTIKFFAHN